MKRGSEIKKGLLNIKSKVEDAAIAIEDWNISVSQWNKEVFSGLKEIPAKLRFVMVLEKPSEYTKPTSYVRNGQVWTGFFN
jgi:hypothetical protein